MFSKLLLSLTLAAAAASGDGPGNGLSKSTYGKRDKWEPLFAHSRRSLALRRANPS